MFCLVGWEKEEEVKTGDKSKKELLPVGNGQITFRYMLFAKQNKRGCFIFLKILFIFLERGGGRKRRETWMCERYIDALPLTRPQRRTPQQPRHVLRLGIQPGAL